MARTKRPDVEEARAKMEVPLKGTTYVLEFKTVDSQLLDSRDGDPNERAESSRAAGCWC